MPTKPDKLPDPREGFREAERRIADAPRDVREIDLSNLGLTALPGSLAGLTNLRFLNLSGNRLSRLPDWFTSLANLERLWLGRNKFRSVASGISKLTHLSELYVADNAISKIPDWLADFEGIQRLSFSGNRLTSLPERMGKSLAHLWVYTNPKLGIPQEIVASQDPRKILDYYHSQKDGSRPLNEAKLILVGQGGVGKTSLVKTLVTGKFDSREKTTEGIKINDWTCKINKTTNVKVHIWDFGGQEMMHSTHQFFLTARSLYLLVLHRRSGNFDKEADYWFRLIRAFGGKDAPVIVVLNKQKLEPFDVNRGGWLERYAGNIKGFVTTDCADKKSIKQIEQAIREQLSSLESLKARFPTRWFAIKDELATMKSQYVTFDRYRAICRKHGEKDQEKQMLLAGFLHDLGIALNYKNDPRLRFAQVLKPEWVTGGIYALLHAFVKEKGLFTRSDAEQVLGQKKYSVEAAHFILGLLEQFELGFALPDSKKRILIPQLLDDQQPVEVQKFALAKCLNFGYQYSIVPDGLLPRFIVRTEHMSEPATRWKSGVILKDESTGCRALVRSDVTESQVRIHVDGPEAMRRDLLAVIRSNFEVIHGDYEFKPQDLVYPAGLPNKPQRLDELMTIQRDGINSIPIVADGGTTIAQVADLIEPKPPRPLKLFLSYAHKDERHLNELRKRLKLMERNGLIRVWSDHALSAGERWEPRILQELKEADAIVCQISSDFLASDFCVLTELEIAIKRAEANEAALIAYVLKDSGWKDVPQLKTFQLLPRGTKPLADWKNKDKYWLTVAEGIQEALAKLQKRLHEEEAKRPLGFASMG